MSEHHEHVPQIPVSAGIPLIARLALLVCVAGTVAILSIVGGTSMQGHVWPSEDSAKVPLGPDKTVH